MGGSGEQEKLPRAKLFFMAPGERLFVPGLVEVSTKSQNLKAGRDLKDPLVLESPL